MNLKKPLAVAVILLFIGLAFAPSIHANISKESDLVEIATEVCGLNGGKQTVKLTQEEAEEVETLFDSIRERLNATETREKAEEVFKEAVVELDKYGLLGGLSVKQAQRLVTGGYRNIKDINLIERMNKNVGIDGDWNLFCLIAGHTTNTFFFGPSCTVNYLASQALISLIFTIGFLEIWNILGDLLPLFLLVLIEIVWHFIFTISTGLAELFHVRGAIRGIISSILPFQIGGCITLGERLYPMDWPSNKKNPSDGWLFTLGLNGLIKPVAPFYGQFIKIVNPLHLYYYFLLRDLEPYSEIYLPIGIVGFTGIKINIFSNAFYFGSALLMKVGQNFP